MALMGLLCCHDVVLFMTNMCSAGEKQHYVIALIETLFQHLPPTFCIGLLYDIGCQLECSCVKWNFLDRYMSRLTFGISVFHAFGHQWACQVIYHPRKREGFGLSDGEGCERFWHSISKLIAYLRVCGSHQRLYTLDRQVQFGTTEIHQNFRIWLQHRYKHAQQKLHHTQALIDSCEKTVDCRQSRNAGRNAVQELMHLRETRDELKHDVEIYNVTLMQEDFTADEHLELMADIRGAKEKLRDLTLKIRHKESVLDVDEHAQLERLVKNPYIASRVNALAVKQRLRERLRSRKFELERVERSFRKQVNDDKINEHTATSVKRRDPSISKLASTFNALQQKLVEMIKAGRAPPGSSAPARIETKGLFALDVDDAIWQDVGLTDDSHEEDVGLPPWLADDK
ncbi:hypothetical protein H0H92_006807, partial [Tricholoma furcatifolium]